MFKLIMADLKVLEKRIWQIPLGILLMTIISAFLIPSVNYSTQFIKFSLLPITVALLGYRLMGYYSQSKLHNEVGSLPCSKIKIVLQKYFMILFFALIGAVNTYAFLKVMSFLTGYTFNLSDLFAVLNLMFLLILRLSIFSIPLFFYFKSVKTAFYGTIIWMAALVAVYLPFVSRGPLFSGKVHENVIMLIALAVFSVLALIVLKIQKNEMKTQVKNLMIIPTVIILPTTIFATITNLGDILNQYLLFSYMKAGYKRMYGLEDKSELITEAYRNSQIAIQTEYLILNAIVTGIFFIVLFYIWKKGTIKNIIVNLSRLIFIPICFLAFEASLFFFIYISAIILSGNNPKIALDGAWFIAQYIIFVPMLIVSIYYSKKFLTDGGK